jgi:hypothetical protein
MLWNLSQGDWICPKCGKSDVRVHCQEYTGKERDTWAARQERLDDPEIAKCCEEAKKGPVPIPWIDDLTWLTCEYCGYDLPKEEREKVRKIMSKFWQDFRDGKVKIYEGVGVVFVNNYAINAIDFTASRSSDK